MTSLLGLFGGVELGEIGGWDVFHVSFDNQVRR